MNTPSRTTADEDLLSNAQFDPVFDADGNLVDIIHLEITTDRSRGIRAMEELAATHEPGDDCVHADGWTGKWKRILNTRAPGAAHTIKQTKRWNSQEGAFLPSATLIVPFEVVWTLFDRLFFGRYSIDVKDVHFDTEDVLESTAEGARNLTGRVFYARAQVAITLHLENGQTRTYTGVGVSYDSVKSAMTGNVYAINSARRMAEKGAVSDAKREALATIGRVFNRGYEDGAQALREIESKLLDRMRGANQARPVRATVAAPRKKTDEKPEEERVHIDTTPDDYIPIDAYATDVPEDDGVPMVAEETIATNASDEVETETVEETATAPTGYVALIDGQQVGFDDAKALFDAVFQALETLDGGAQAQALLEANRATLLRAEEDPAADGATYADLEALIEPLPETASTTAEALVEEEPAIDPITHGIKPASTTGLDILKAYEVAFQAKDANVEAILMANTEWAKRLTKRQALELAVMAAAAKSKG